MSAFLERLTAFPVQSLTTPLNEAFLSDRLPVHVSSSDVSYRMAGSGSPLVLLHGIGSASGSWVNQLEALQVSHRVLAWDAPGYGASTPLPQATPFALDYAQRLWDWLDVLALQAPLQASFQAPITLVGHSLGALMAAAAATLRPSRVNRVVLLSPAKGYAKADAVVRDSKLNDRLALLNRLGPSGLAQARSAAMLSPHASDEQQQWVQHLMAAIDPWGYAQASFMLSNDDLAQHLQQLQAFEHISVEVACGSLDGITPLAGCLELAQAFDLPFTSLGDVGHACPIEASQAVCALLKGSL